MSKLACCFCGLLSCLTVFTAKAEQTEWRLEKVADGFVIPWGQAWLSPTQLLVSERGGRLWLVDITSGQRQQLKGLPAIYAQGQGGLLDVQLAPAEKNHSWIYFTYSKPVAGGGATTLARARIEQDSLVDWQDLLVTESASSNGRHFGSRIAFDHQGHVFFSVGDRGHRPNGQDRLTHASTIIRLKLDGSVPADNPYRENTDKALPEIWSWGHRNPQGLWFDSQSQRLWSVEHGPRGGDELNLIEPGVNYGWAAVSLGKEYWNPLYVGDARSQAGMRDPVHSWTPSVSPGSLLVYRGEMFKQWQGNLFAGALSGAKLVRLVLDADGNVVEEHALLKERGERVRSISEAADGSLYIATDSGSLYRLFLVE